MKVKPIAVGVRSYTGRDQTRHREYTVVIQDGDTLTGFALRDPAVPPVAGVDVDVDLSQGFAVRRPYTGPRD